MQAILARAAILQAPSTWVYVVPAGLANRDF